MNLGLITNIKTDEFIGVIGIDKDKVELGYITINEELDEIIELILDNEKLELSIEESFNNKKITRKEKIDLTNSLYLTAFNYYLPLPWRITKLIYKEGDLKENIEELYNMEVELNEKESE